jgi:nitrate reductase assembly molybdenum cofactor insertion protein NarJ
MTEFLALSCGCEGSDAALRVRFIERMMLDGTRLFAERLSEAESIYGRLAQALLLCLEREIASGGAEPAADAEAAAGGAPAQPAGSRAKVLTIE